MDPGRWPDDDMTDLERRLLEAARNDRVPDALSARMAESLQAAGATLAGGTTAAKLSAPLLVKTGLWGVLSVGLFVAVVRWSAVDATPTPRTAPEGRHVAQPHAQPAAELPPPRAPGRAASTAGDSATASKGSPQARPASQGDDALHAEVALLARVRQALQQQASALALRLLDRHQTRFAQGTLVPEAAALRIEALTQQGSYELAEAKTEQFVKFYPAHPLRAHVANLRQSREDTETRP